MPLSDLFHDAAYSQEEAALARLRELYLDDLRVVLGSAEGRRVIFRWLDEARTFGLISGASAEEVLKAAAVSDYGRARIMEIRQADPEGFLHIMTAGFSALIHRDTSSDCAVHSGHGP